VAAITQVGGDTTAVTRLLYQWIGLDLIRP